MADPEQIHAEVLSEEQAKGVSAPVAEGRAKAARARAEAGSPHPKEPKWWPGSQPHLEGGGEAPAEEAAEETVEEEAAEAEPAAAPVTETPAATEEQQAPEVPQEQTTPPPVAPAAEAPAQPAAAAVAAPPEARPAGVTHGTIAGNRLRPEDGSSTEAQFEGQAAMYERRKLIDELIATGVPTVSAADTGARRSPALAFLYLLIPIMAIAFLLAQNDTAPAEAGGGGHGGGEESGAVTLTAAAVQFETNSISLPAETETTLEFINDDAVPHNVSIYEDDTAEADLFVGQEIAGGASTDYSIPALEAGEFFFRCDLHPTSMIGTVTVE